MSSSDFSGGAFVVASALLAALVACSSTAYGPSVDGGGASGAGATAGASGAGATAGAGGAGATAGAGGGTSTSRLGRACATDAECGAGLTCITANASSLDGEGAPKGYCTASCTSNADCDALSPGAGCVGNADGLTAYCYQGCAWGPASGAQALDPNKCFGRQEVSCRGYFTNPEAGTGTPDVFLCSPTCNFDTDCGSGSFCNGGTGHCAAAKPAGLAMGAACNPQEAVDPCAGSCIRFGDDEDKGICSGVCTIGTLGGPGACGSDPTPNSKQTAGCIFVQRQSEGNGDLGFCGNFCDCDSECADGLVCDPWDTANATEAALESFTKMAGMCVSGGDPEGGVDGGIPTCP
ncbi:MAG: hypothetical protein OZ921_11040 [Sorangiineae bacterium]|nr:hypothetical protein [Polyangiaceae bacterium]MEB2323042.1 hypothetical protein [Sorangiineae bacterium]